MSTLRVEIDLNDVNGDGLTKVLADELPGAIVGDEVTVFQPEDGVEAPAIVAAVNPVYISLRVAWAQMTRVLPAVVTSHSVNVGVASSSAPASRQSHVGPNEPVTVPSLS